ncbi:hypothetical protein CWI38_0736p0030 [Hamiltosporidium tvaerminnensis]|uniref:Uncharacterized protein n=1 Tax=Hamiltosporidium tvaerminnensis TaxID=1176355 RepID=A0A4V2JXN9_9MICR|nr:hypothetical protein CWI38_0736p0030 [Hamiltosporidium tvaerminnensis]
MFIFNGNQKKYRNSENGILGKRRKKGLTVVERSLKIFYGKIEHRKEFSLHLRKEGILGNHLILNYTEFDRSFAENSEIEIKLLGFDLNAYFEKEGIIFNLENSQTPTEAALSHMMQPGFEKTETSEVMRMNTEEINHSRNNIIYKSDSKDILKLDLELFFEKIFQANLEIQAKKYPIF